MTQSPHLRNELIQQHERLESTLQGLVRAAESIDRSELQRVWTVFERELSAHLDYEESKLFPLVEGFHPGEIQALRSEHRHIRNVVAKLGVSCDLHSLNQDALLELVESLRRHAEREDRTLYPWVEELAPLGTRRHLLGLLARTVHAEVASR